MPSSQSRKILRVRLFDQNRSNLDEFEETPSILNHQNRATNEISLEEEFDMALTDEKFAKLVKEPDTAKPVDAQFFHMKDLESRQIDMDMALTDEKFAKLVKEPDTAKPVDAQFFHMKDLESRQIDMDMALKDEKFSKLFKEPDTAKPVDAQFFHMKDLESRQIDMDMALKDEKFAKLFKEPDTTKPVDAQFMQMNDLESRQIDMVRGSNNRNVKLRARLFDKNRPNLDETEETPTILNQGNRRTNEVSLEEEFDMVLKDEKVAKLFKELDIERHSNPQNIKLRARLFDKNRPNLDKTEETPTIVNQGNHSIDEISLEGEFDMVLKDEIVAKKELYTAEPVDAQFFYMKHLESRQFRLKLSDMERRSKTEHVKLRARLFDKNRPNLDETEETPTILNQGNRRTNEVSLEEEFDMVLKDEKVAKLFKELDIDRHSNPQNVKLRARLFDKNRPNLDETEETPTILNQGNRRTDEISLEEKFDMVLKDEKVAKLFKELDIERHSNPQNVKLRARLFDKNRPNFDETEETPTILNQGNRRTDEISHEEEFDMVLKDEKVAKLFKELDSVRGSKPPNVKLRARLFDRNLPNLHETEETPSILNQGNRRTNEVSLEEEFDMVLKDEKVAKLFKELDIGRRSKTQNVKLRARLFDKNRPNLDETEETPSILDQGNRRSDEISLEEEFDMVLKDEKVAKLFKELDTAEKVDTQFFDKENLESRQSDIDIGKHSKAAAADVLLMNVADMTSREFVIDPEAHIDVARARLQDRNVISIFQEVILGNKDLFRGRIVMDVGCGMGILALFAAKAGAARVFAVDSSNALDYTVQIVKDNGYADVIHVIKGRLDDIDLPVEKVDIIISSWMGYALFTESRLDAVLYARDKWLKPGGLIFPNVAELFFAPVTYTKCRNERISWWNFVYDFRMKCMGEYSISEPCLVILKPEQMMAPPILIKRLNLDTATKKDIQFGFKCKVTPHKDGEIDGMIIFFDVHFEKAPGRLRLATGPGSPLTRWAQSLCFFDDSFFVRKNQNLFCHIEWKYAKEYVADHNDMKLTMSVTRHTGLVTKKTWNFRKR